MLYITDASILYYARQTLITRYSAPASLLRLGIFFFGLELDTVNYHTHSLYMGNDDS